VQDLRLAGTASDKSGMRPRRIRTSDIIDKHRITCPRCHGPEAIVLLNDRFEVLWQCVDCESRWPASDEESALILGPSMKVIH
jgi:hypothetical protein